MFPRCCFSPEKLQLLQSCGVEPRLLRISRTGGTICSGQMHYSNEIKRECQAKKIREKRTLRRVER